MGKGWFGDSVEHGLAAMGIETRGKSRAGSKYFQGDDLTKTKLDRKRKGGKYEKWEKRHNPCPPKISRKASAFISKETREQRKVGTPQKQAVAIAYSKARQKFKGISKR